jgi:hypothetical protein
MVKTQTIIEIFCTVIDMPPSRTNQSRERKKQLAVITLKGSDITMGIGSIVGLFILITDIQAITGILRSGATTEDKILWTVLILILPIIGFFLWLLAGPRKGRT